MSNNNRKHKEVIIMIEKSTVIDSVKTYLFHRLGHNYPIYVEANADPHASVKQFIDGAYNDCDFDGLANYHPKMTELVSYFDYWYNTHVSIVTSSSFPISDKQVHKLIPQFKGWIASDPNIPDNVQSLSTFIFDNKDDPNYHWNDQVFECTMRHCKDFMLANLKGQFVGKMPGCSIEEIEKALCSFEDTADYHDYFPHLTKLVVYFCYWHSNCKPVSSGMRKNLMHLFPTWLNQQPNVSKDLLGLYKLFMNWYPHRKITRGFNYDNWGFNV